MDERTQTELREQSMAELLARLSRETTLLVRQEIDLAKAELTERGRAAGSGAALFGVGTVLALGAFGALTATLILALSLVIAPWLAALVVTVAYAIGAYVMALDAKKKLKEAQNVAPDTIETLKEDIEWAKTRNRSGAR